MPDAIPFTTFNFLVNLELPGEDGKVCDAAFSDCSGLEMTLAPKSIREGGNNGRQIHLVGPVSYGQLTLKRGMTEDFGLWRWFERVQTERSVRASGQIQMLAPDRKKADVRFNLSGCLPVKIKAPSLSAKDGLIAIEEMQLVYETLSLQET
jgi:phage tail-like protein